MKRLNGGGSAVFDTTRRVRSLYRETYEYLGLPISQDSVYFRVWARVGGRLRRRLKETGT